MCRRAPESSSVAWVRSHRCQNILIRVVPGPSRIYLLTSRRRQCRLLLWMLGARRRRRTRCISGWVQASQGRFARLCPGPHLELAARGGVVRAPIVGWCVAESRGFSRRLSVAFATMQAGCRLVRPYATALLGRASMSGPSLGFGMAWARQARALRLNQTSGSAQYPCG